MRKKLEELVLQNYAQIAPEVLSALLEMLHVARVQCHGDLDKYLILMVISARTVQQPDFIPMAQAQMDSGEPPVVPGCGTNIRSIAESVDMPRETTRRKVQELIEAGWIARDGQLLYPTAKAYEELVPLREASARQVVRYFEAVTKLQAKAAS